MQRRIGFILGSLLVRFVLPAIFGLTFMMYFDGVVVALIVLLAINILWTRYKVRRLERKSCDDAIFYARKKRRAFDEPDFTQAELSAMKSAQGRGDYRQVYSIISNSNQMLCRNRLTEENRSMEKESADYNRAVQRDAELRLYRA